MKRILTLTILLILLCSPAWAAVTNYYVTQSGSGTEDGKTYANSWSVATFNIWTNWSGSDDADKIDSDDTVYLCDAITTALTPKAADFTSGESTIRGDLAGHAGTVTVASGHALQLYKDGYITFRNLTLNNTGTGNVIYIDPDSVKDRSNIKIHDCIIQAGNVGTPTLTYGIKFRGAEGSYNVQNIWVYDNTIEHLFKGEITHSVNTVAQPSDGISMYITQSGRDHGPLYIHHNNIKGFPHGQIVVTTYSLTQSQSLDEIYIWENELSGEGSHAESYMRGISIQGKNAFIFRNYLHDLTVRNQNYYGKIHFYNNVYANSVAFSPDGGGGGYVGGAGTDTTAHDECKYYNNTYYALDEAAIYMAWNGAGSLDLVDIRNNIFHDCGSGNSGNRANLSTSPIYSWETICFANQYNSDYIDSIILNNNIFYLLLMM